MKKKLICIFLIITIFATLTLTFSGCTLFNDGSIDEIYGVYMLDYYTYKYKNNVTYNCGGNYDYFVLVIEKGNQATIIYKFEENTEVRYVTTYEVIYKENSSTVDKIKIKDFSALSFVLDKEDNKIMDAYDYIEDYELSLHAKREELHYNKYSPTLTSGFKWESTTETINFTKVTGKVKDKNIEKAIDKNKSKKEERPSNVIYKGSLIDN